MSKKRIKELGSLIKSHKEAIEDCKKEKVELQNKLILPKVTKQYLNKYFRKADFFDKKETMLICVKEILSVYEYKGVKIQFHPNGSLSIDINYIGNFSSIGKEVDNEVWKDELLRARYLVGEISFV